MRGSARDLEVSVTAGGFLRCNALSSGLQDEAPVTGEEGIPALRNFTFSNIHVSACPVLADVTGVHSRKPLEGFALTNVTGNCAQGISLANVRNAELRDIHVTGYARPLLSVVNVTGTGLEGASALAPPKEPDLVSAPVTPFVLK